MEITASQNQLYKQQGHILLKNVADGNSIVEYRNHIVQAAKKYNVEKRKIEERDTYGKAFLQIMNLWEVDEEVRKFTLNEKFGRIAAQLMGVEKVRLYHDQALFKEAGGGPTPWHQDQYYWPIDTTNTITMWMPLIDINLEMGMLTFASGSHELGYLGDLAISDDSEAVLSNIVKDKGYAISRAETMLAGDATFHSGFTVHSAPGNYSDKMREVMTVIYIADGAKVTEPKNKNQEADRKRWLYGLEPGSLVNSKYNPLLF
jgi:ectoine hydroxylase-related dioxygenase (phytanoyl-CoA dioxygenase family)